MKKDMNYCETKEQKAFKFSEGFSIKRIKKAMLLMGISMALAGCGGADNQAGDSDGAASSASQENAGAAENANASESIDLQENADGTKAGAENAAGAETASPQDIYKSIEESIELPSMVEGDDDFISNYYGIDPANLDSYVFASAEDAALATSVIIMKAKSEDVVDELVNSLNTVVEQKAAEMQGYIPEQYDIVADSSVKTSGLYVYLVIAENAGDIEAIISAAVK